MLGTFLRMMDGINSVKGVFVLAASNRKDTLPENVLERLGEHIEVGLPETPERRRLLALFTKNLRVSPEVDLGAIASATEGMSGRKIAALCQRAGRDAAMHNSEITQQHFDSALPESAKSKEVHGGTPLNPGDVFKQFMGGQ
jgi:SpoVK/Ycf46/Vps4 family AAA+-type ATPase